MQIPTKNKNSCFKAARTAVINATLTTAIMLKGKIYENVVIKRPLLAMIQLSTLFLLLENRPTCLLTSLI